MVGCDHMKSIQPRQILLMSIFTNSLYIPLWQAITYIDQPIDHSKDDNDNDNNVAWSI